MQYEHINLECQKASHVLAWKIAKLGFSIIVSHSFDKSTAKIVKQLGTFFF